MPTTYKVLGQSAPSATSNTTLYTVPSSTSAVCSTLAVCNRGPATTFRVAVRAGGSSLANQHYIVYDAFLDQYQSVYLTIGATLQASTIVTVYAGTASVSFSLFGSELT